MVLTSFFWSNSVSKWFWSSTSWFRTLMVLANGLDPLPIGVTVFVYGHSMINVTSLILLLSFFLSSRGQINFLTNCPKRSAPKKLPWVWFSYFFHVVQWTFDAKDLSFDAKGWFDCMKKIKLCWMTNVHNQIRFIQLLQKQNKVGFSMLCDQPSSSKGPFDHAKKKGFYLVKP